VSTYPVTGFWGKLPSRGDFVRAALSRDFIEPWDAWLSAAMAETRDRLGEAWHDAWMIAPVWRFALSAELCGPRAVVGLWMPSVDRAGRHFPLTIATEIIGPTASHLAAASTAWLDSAEIAGRAALQFAHDPDELASHLPPYAPGDADEPFDAESLWWTDGSPNVDAQHFSQAILPGPDQFFRMIAGSDP
jgi:type VI secretion system protein ImpM